MEINQNLKNDVIHKKEFNFENYDQVQEFFYANSFEFPQRDLLF